MIGAEVIRDCPIAAIEGLRTLAKARWLLRAGRSAKLPFCGDQYPVDRVQRAAQRAERRRQIADECDERLAFAEQSVAGVQQLVDLGA